MKKKKILAILCAACMLAMGGCGDSNFDLPDYETEEGASVGGNDTASTSADNSPAEKTAFDGISMRLGDSGDLIINRDDIGSVPMGEDGTWTVFVYLCGTDLESDGGYATDDVLEMLNASTGSNVKFVVQTGGTYIWQNDVMTNNSLCRYEISDGEIVLLDEQPAASMGAGSTLADFLSWGVENHAAARMGLVFWNHGGGSITGVCFDELNESDSLSLPEISDALAQTAAEMTAKFEFIGFDACLMGTIETANVLATYSRYMYGSEESEPGGGWDYTAIGDYLGEYPDADGAQLGKVVCDSFYADCEEISQDSFATLSVIDLSKIDDVIISFNDYAKALYDASGNNSVLSDVVRKISYADNFGGNNKSEGYTNMVDFAGIVQAGAEYGVGADNVLSALDKAVVYMRNGSDHRNACGLATYYPLQLQGTQELKVFGNVAVSPYYLAFVDRTVYGNSNNGDTDGYDFSSIFDFFFGEDDDTDQDNYWDNYGECEPTGDSPLIVFYDEPQFLEDGTYGFSLTDESLQYTAGVQANVFVLSDDMETIIELGVSADIYADWEYGVFTDNFDGYWFALPDGQILAVYIVCECDGYDVYTSPVLLNGEETNLRITYDYVSGTVTIDGVWDGIDENGMASRDIYAVNQGDRITPMYFVMAVESDDEGYWYGSEYVFESQPQVYFDLLPDGEYLYNFNIDDIYGDFKMTDFVNFTIEGENIYFSDLS
ncbi:MAG: clostripain-related cysteine peptidase [Oscillospiraceae bacterium]